MKRHRLGFFALFASFLIAGVGCFPAIAPNTNSNGDSGTLISTVSKLADPEENIGALNSAEWQILADEVEEVLAMLPEDLNLPIPEDFELPPLSDEEAEAIENFLDDNNVQTYEDLVPLSEAIIAGEVEVPPELVELWEELVSQFVPPEE